MEEKFLTTKTAITKEEIESLSADVIDKLDTGEIRALLLKERFKAISEIEERVKSKLNEMAVKEASSYPEKEISLHGAVFKIQEAGVTFDFKSCGDPVWERLNNEFEKSKKAIKGHESLVDEDTGEIVTVYAPIRRSTTIVQCSIK